MKDGLSGLSGLFGLFRQEKRVYPVRGEGLSSLSGLSGREKESISLVRLFRLFRHCEERSDEAICFPCRLPRTLRVLAMTGCGAAGVQALGKKSQQPTANSRQKRKEGFGIQASGFRKKNPPRSPFVKGGSPSTGSGWRSHKLQGNVAGRQ